MMSPMWSYPTSTFLSNIHCTASLNSRGWGSHPPYMSQRDQVTCPVLHKSSCVSDTTPEPRLHFHAITASPESTGKIGN